MTGGTPSNIFDAAGGKGPKKEEAPQEVTKEELDRRIKKIYEYHDQIEKGLDQIYQLSGYNPQQIALFLRNPANLNADQRRALEIRQERLAKQIVLKTEKKIKSKAKQAEDALKRKGKSLGSRKGWISM